MTIRSYGITIEAHSGIVRCYKYINKERTLTDTEIIDAITSCNAVINEYEAHPNKLIESEKKYMAEIYCFRGNLRIRRQ